MTIRRDMVKAVSRAENVLGSSVGLVVEYLLSQINPDGGFSARDGRSDLYYSLFGAEALVGLNADVPVERIVGFFYQFTGLESLDIVHLASLVRCLADLSQPLGSQLKKLLIRRLSRYRSADGGYDTKIDSETGTMYGCFLAVGLCQDLGVDVPAPDKLLGCIESLHRPDGSYANDKSIVPGSTPAAAAAVTILHYFDRPVNGSTLDWLGGQFLPSGGCLAVPAAPMADLLSTAVAVHGLALAGVPLDNLKEPTLDFIDSLWNGRGGFYGNSADATADCEYTYYGLLALGRLG